MITRRCMYCGRDLDPIDSDWGTVVFPKDDVVSHGVCCFCLPLLERDLGIDEDPKCKTGLTKSTYEELVDTVVPDENEELE